MLLRDAGESENGLLNLNDFWLDVVPEDLQQAYGWFG